MKFIAFLIDLAFDLITMAISIVVGICLAPIVIIKWIFANKQ